MEITRKINIETTTDDIQVGDQVKLKNNYTATCQQITKEGKLFLLDQYLDEVVQMNPTNTNKGGYMATTLRAWLISPRTIEEVIPEDITLGKFESGDTFRLPTMTEMFGKVYEWAEPTGDEGQPWPLMTDRRNRVTYRANDWEYGWLQNVVKQSAASFCGVGGHGYASCWRASGSLGVRPAFLIV